MHLLVAINNNVEEWRTLQVFDSTKPRLPLPYTFGGAFLRDRHSISAFDLYSQADKHVISPFSAMYYKNELGKALASVDIAFLWGSVALKAIFRQAITPGARKNIIYFTYVFSPEQFTAKHRINKWAQRALASSAKGLVLMTGEQACKAQEMLGEAVPVVRFRCGIDTAFYREEAAFTNIPERYRGHIEKLLVEPYVIMPGDELRINEDAIRFVKQSGIRLVRISQYGDKSGTEKLKHDIDEHDLGDRLLVFEKIDYVFLRFLLRHASAYAGFVDSSWQPAGWTVACEALSSGLPMVIYDGLVSRELIETGVPAHLVQTVDMRDVATFTVRLAELASSGRSKESAEQASSFAERQLDFGDTAPAFVAEIEKLVAAP